MTKLYEIDEPEKIWVRCSACSTAYCIIESRCPNCNMPFTNLDNAEIVEIRKKQTEIEEKLQSNYEKEISSTDEEIDEKKDNSSMSYLDRKSYYEKKKEDQLKGKIPIPTATENGQSVFEKIKSSNYKDYLIIVGGLLFSFMTFTVVLGSYNHFINELQNYIINPSSTTNAIDIQAITSLIVVLFPLIAVMFVIKRISKYKI
jgi:hypothetical protein